MILDDYKTLFTLNSTKLYNNLYNNFDSYYFIIIIFIEKGLYVEFRYILFKAFTLIK
jgi:hypothetical protein